MDFQFLFLSFFISLTVVCLLIVGVEVIVAIYHTP
jgi:hypothetical protein